MGLEVFRGRTAVGTGASRGIGRELAIALAAAGSRVALAARDADALAAVAAEVTGRGGTAIVVPTDETVPADCRRLASATVEAFGRLDLLVNNAGISMLARDRGLPRVRGDGDPGTGGRGGCGPRRRPGGGRRDGDGRVRPEDPRGGGRPAPGGADDLAGRGRPLAQAAGAPPGGPDGGPGGRLASLR